MWIKNKVNSDQLVWVHTVFKKIQQFFWFDTISLGWSIVYIKGSLVIISKYNCISFSDGWYCLSSVDPDEMLHYAAFYLSLHCLQKYPFISH